MTKKIGHFDVTSFYEALESTRQARGVTWREIARQTGISASTLTRLAQGKRPDVDSLAALSTWSGLSSDDYIRPGLEKIGAEPLATISTELRNDPNLSPEAAEALEEIVRAAYNKLRTDQ